MLNQIIDRIEFVAAVMLSIAIVTFGIINCISGEGIWQDEASSLALAKMSFGELWSLLHLDSFPPLLHLTLKSMFWMGVSESPMSLRIIGFCIWLIIVGLLWWRLRRQGGAPLASLVLFASVPWMIRYGQSIRAYGLATILGITLITFAWEYVRKPTWKNGLIVSVFGLLGTHCLYQSSFLLASVCAGAAAVVCMRRSWKQLTGIVAIAIPSALTIPAYFPVVSKGAASFRVFADKVIGPKALIWGVVKTVSTDMRMPAVWWLGFLAISFIVALRLFWQGTKEGVTTSPELIHSPREFAVFSLVTAVSFSCSSMFVLWLTSAYVNPWHLLLWVGIIGALADNMIVAGTPRLRPVVRLAIVSAAIVCVAGNLVTGWNALNRKYTSMDVVARVLERQASSNDFIIVYPWACGTSFNYYYRGLTPWATIPPLADYRMHRSDLVLNAMRQPGAIDPIEQEILRALSRGGNVWLVGHFEDAEGTPLIKPVGLAHEPWLLYWSATVMALLRAKATSVELLHVPLKRPVNGMENPPLWVARGVLASASPDR